LNRVIAKVRWKRGSAFEFASLTPHIKKNLADEVFRKLFIPYEPEPEAKHPDSVPSVQHLHGEAVACDPSALDVVRQPPVSQLMAVSLGLSGWGGLWFDGKGKFFKLSQSFTLVL
jgi:hypothetical protein